MSRPLMLNLHIESEASYVLTQVPHMNYTQYKWNKQFNQLTKAVMTAYNNTTNNHNWKNMIFPRLL